jgi:polyisoprenoid-binding protein YceI
MKTIKITLMLAVVALFSFTVVEQFSYTVDNAHSRLGFTIKHMGISDFNGNFGKFETKITTSKEDFSDAVVELSADVNTINTGNEMRDGHLKSADFFETEKFPTLTFKSTSFKLVKGKNYKIEGELTMHGVSKKVTLDAIHYGNVENPQNKKTVAGFKVTGVVKRSDFGIGAGFPAPGLSDEVNLIADLELGKN